MKFREINRLLTYVLYTSVIFFLGLWIGIEFFLPGPKLAFQESNNKLEKIINYIDNYYLDSTDLNNLSDKAIQTITDGLDPYSQYFPASYFDNTQPSLDGNFGGVGIEFNIFKDTVFVINVISGGPSQKSGILPGDKIISVDGNPFVGKEIDNLKVIQTLRGEKGTKVNIGILRSAQQANFKTFTIIRDQIPITTVNFTKISDKQIGYIKISRFGAKTHQEFKKIIDLLIADGINKLIIDVRGNGGGYLKSVVDIASEFLKSNTLIVYTDGREDYFDDVYKTNQEGTYVEGDVIILIDEYSASASEILAGALQDNDRALVLGRRSFGKGLVQRSFNFKDGSKINLTISRYYTPSGRCIQKPYKNKEKYTNDLLKRFETGEFFTKDNINFDSSALFYTQNGRKVYGKGGIIPDYFMAIDTNYYSPLLKEIIQKNILNEFSFKIANEYRIKLENMGLETFKVDSKFENLILHDLIVFMGHQGLYIQKNALLQSVSYRYILTFTKALIARQLWGEESYYSIIVHQDKIINKAIFLFPEISNILKKIE